MFSLQKFGGITKYFCELMKNYTYDNEYKLSVLFSNNQHLKDDFDVFKKFYLPVSTKSTKMAGFCRRKMYDINQIYSSGIIKSNDYDLFHPTYYDPYFFKVLEKPYIITVHDLISFRFKDKFRNEHQREKMKLLINNSKRIIAISEHTKTDLIEILNVPVDKIDVIYHGFNKFIQTDQKNDRGRYILFVGARLNYKNFKKLAEAFALLTSSDSDLKLICVGPEFNKEENDYLTKYKIKEKTTSLRVNEKELNHLYSFALAFIYPTLYEGFGMPILEAFANDCPVCLSNASCLPEIAGDAGNYFDPNDAESIFETIRQIIYNADYSAKKIEKGKERLKSFSWKKCAEQTIESYRKTLD